MYSISNPYRGVGLDQDAGIEPGELVVDPHAACTLFDQCPHRDTTPLRAADDLAADLGIAAISVKDERTRMGLGSFKALGAAFAIAKQAARAMTDRTVCPVDQALVGETFVCASAGNHGLSLAAGARIFGAKAVVYLSETVPESFADRLRDDGAQVVRAGAVYEDSMAAAQQAADVAGWQLLSDSSWLGYKDPARDVMEGYLIMTAEVAEQMTAPPSHVLLQAGVGGLAAASTAAVRHYWGADPVVIVVEPEAAPALIESIERGRPVATNGSVSSMGRLDCKEPSHLALSYLAREADFFVTLSDQEVAATLPSLDSVGLGTTPSGAAGLSVLFYAQGHFGLNPSSHVLAYLTETGV